MSPRKRGVYPEVKKFYQLSSEKRHGTQEKDAKEIKE